MQVDQLVAELLARGDMNDETTLDLNRILDDWRAGRLDPDDDAYLRAFHARFVHQTVELEPEMSPPPVQRIDGLSIEEWRERALRAEAELAGIEDASRNG